MAIYGTPSYGESLRDAMRAQIELGPELWQAEAEARQRYGQLETNILRDTLLGRGDQKGMLDFMGAPAQQFTTGDVQYQPPWADPALEQFQQAFAPQDGQQAQQQQVMDRQRRGPMAGGLVQQQIPARMGQIVSTPRGERPFLDEWFSGKEGARGSVTNPYPQRGTPEYDSMIAEDRADPTQAEGWAMH